MTKEEIVEAMVGWFYANFEDPAHSTSYNSREGGYLYNWGGPYDATEQLQEVFGGKVSDDLIQQAADEVESEGLYDWAPNSSRMIEVYDEDDYPDEYRPKIAFQKLNNRLDELKELLQSAPVTVPGVGHNNPPGSVDAPPFYEEDRQAVLNAMAILRNQEESPTEFPVEAKVAAEQIKSYGERLRAWGFELAERAGKKFAESFAAEFGKMAAWGIGALGVWSLLSDKMIEVYNTVQNWISALQLPF